MFLFKGLEYLPWALGVSIIVCVFVVIANFGVFIVRKVVNVKTLKAHHDVAGFVFANLGVLYAVLLGFIVVNAQQRFDKISETAEVEASILQELYRDSNVFPTENKVQIRRSLYNYIDNVISEEWPSMSESVISIQTLHALNSIWTAYYDLTPRSTKEEIWYSQSISKLNDLMKVRLTRIIQSGESIGTEMWSLLIMGGIVIVSFMWFFGLDNLMSHMLMASILAATTAFLLFLIYSLDTPFSGAVSIQPEALERTVASFDLQE